MRACLPSSWARWSGRSARRDGVRFGGFRDLTSYSRELPPSPGIDLIEALGITYVSSQATSPLELAASIGNIDLVYEAAGHPQFALDVLPALGQNGIYVLTGVPGLQTAAEAGPTSLMRQLVLRNQVLLGTVNAGPGAFAAAIQDLQEFKRRWPQPTQGLIGGRYPIEQATDLIFGRPPGIKTVISFHDGETRAPTSAFDRQAAQVEPVRAHGDVAEGPDHPDQVAVHVQGAEHASPAPELVALGAV